MLESKIAAPAGAGALSPAAHVTVVDQDAAAIVRAVARLVQRCPEHATTLWEAGSMVAAVAQQVADTAEAPAPLH